ncbi:MAG: hypothetical protein H0V62_01915 [Gammaproteobacteria bacterium]|nr:hypothetical protein [Gammaproteobacteria bacterium]
MPDVRVRERRAGRLDLLRVSFIQRAPTAQFDWYDFRGEFHREISIQVQAEVGRIQRAWNAAITACADCV